MPQRPIGAGRAAVESDAQIARLVARLAMEHFLRTLQGLSAMHPGEDLLTVLVHRAIVTANLAHLDVDPAARQFATLAAAPPDEVRRPVSVRAVAASMGVPLETVRRRTNRLIELGLCRRVKGGLIVPAATLEGPDAESALLGNMAGLRRLIWRLQSAGFRLSGAPHPAAEGDTAVAEHVNGERGEAG